MRIDKYLKVSRIIKRRTVANEACSGGRVMISAGDIISIRFGEHVGRYEVLSIAETVRKDQAADLYRVIQEDASINQERNQE